LALRFEVEPKDAIVLWEAPDGTRVVQGSAANFDARKPKKTRSVDLPESGEYLIYLTKDGYPDYVVHVHADASRGNGATVIRATLGGR